MTTASVDRQAKTVTTANVDRQAKTVTTANVDHRGRTMTATTTEGHQGRTMTATIATPERTVTIPDHLSREATTPNGEVRTLDRMAAPNPQASTGIPGQRQERDRSGGRGRRWRSPNDEANSTEDDGSTENERLDRSVKDPITYLYGPRTREGVGHAVEGPIGHHPSPAAERIRASYRSCRQNVSSTVISFLNSGTSSLSRLMPSSTVLNASSR